MKAYLNEFADFDNGTAFDTILAAVSTYGFKDHSWHNDAMPCILAEQDNGFHLIIWVDFKDPNKAEFVDQRKDGTFKQFIFGERDEDGEYTEEWQYDDVNALIAHVEKVMTA